MWLFLAFLLVPLIEIGLFIQVGGLIGLWPTLLIVVLTAIAGTSLVRSQGRLALGQVQRSFRNLNDPTEPLAHGAMILFAGALLLTPGFFTDTCGILLLIPAVRKAVFTYFRSRVTVSTVNFSHPGMRPSEDNPDIVEGDYFEVERPKSPTHQPSGWTKH